MSRTKKNWSEHGKPSFVELNNRAGFGQEQQPGGIQHRENMSASDVKTEKHFVQIPMPGDHYSFCTGSAVMTLVYEFSRKHSDRGGETTVVVARGTRHDYPVGRCAEVEFGRFPPNWQRALDAALGAAGLRRPFTNRFYASAKTVIAPEFDGFVFLQNAPAPARSFKSHAPNARVVLHVHNSLFGTYSRREIAATIAASDLVVCNCEFLANEIDARLRGDRNPKIRVVYNGVDTRRFMPRPDLVDRETVSILFVARMVPEKGADLLIKAGLKLYGGRRKFKLRIVGNQGFSADGPLSPYEIELRKLAAPMGDAVEFLPFVDRHKILPVYQSAGIFCAPSNWNEPCTLTIPEAMACGAPTVASRIGGIPEMAGDAALFFDPPNIDQLAERLAYLIDDEKARQEWSARARVRAEQCDWSHRYSDLRKALGI